ADWGVGLVGDKAHSVLFDNTKIKRFVPDFVCTVPFGRGAEEVMAWFDADPSRQVIDPGFERAMDEIVEAMGRANRG
ncbi:MAG: NAD-dependent dehydratase, partial [Anaerolineae bacterium]|nr:NAD-dependent dehydratase [Anaerolineae bacterium]